MGHYEKRLEDDLNGVRNLLLTIGLKVNTAVKNAIDSLLSGDKSLSYETVLGDHEINRLVKELDKRCLQFMAIHLPSGGLLRFISSAMRVGNELERVGDYASTISREAVQLSKPLQEGSKSKSIGNMASQAQKHLSAALDAFNQKDLVKAKETLKEASTAAKAFDKFFKDLQAGSHTWEQKELFTLLLIFYMLRRISAQSKNICEEAIFSEKGTTKNPRNYKIIFLDENNFSLAPMAYAIAQKKYGDYATFDFACLNPTSIQSDYIVDLAKNINLDLEKVKPQNFSEKKSTIDSYYIIVTLNQDFNLFSNEVPFHSMIQNWKISSIDESDEALSAAFREVSSKLDELMIKLYGAKVRDLENNENQGQI